MSKLESFGYQWATLPQERPKSQLVCREPLGSLKLQSGCGRECNMYMYGLAYLRAPALIPARRNPSLTSSGCDDLALAMAVRSREGERSDAFAEVQVGSESVRGETGVVSLRPTPFFL